MADHDQRFKTLVQECLGEFLMLFLPELIERLDLTATTWLPQEIFPDPPAGQRRYVDLIAQISLRPSVGVPPPNAPRQQVLLLHIEVESADTVEPFRERMFHYYCDLSRKLRLDVLPVAIYLQVGLEGRGRDTYERRLWDRTPLRFEYDYVGLPALPGEEYLHSGNSLGEAWSALMRWPREGRLQAALAALEQIAASEENGWSRLLLAECVQAYAPLEDSQRMELKPLLDEPERGVRTMIKTWTEEAREQGQKIVLERWRRGLLLQLASRFGPLSESVQQKLTALSMDQLEALSEALMTAQSLQELGLENDANGTAR
jgi:hypothetical protein